VQTAIRRLFVIGSMAVAFGAVVAAPALAATATTEAATNITTTTATLVGQANTDGLATYYEFQYGTTTNYNNSYLGTLAAGGSVVNVDLPIHGLKPNTVYHYRFIASNTLLEDYYYYYASPSVGADVTFRTKTIGSLKLSRGTRTISKKTIKESATCSSSVQCKGKLSLTIKVKSGRKTKTLTCGSSRFTIKAGKKGTIKIKLSSKCVADVKKAKHHRLGAKLSAPKLSSGQPKTSVSITLKT
jgi:hypothetical protein